MNTAKMLQTVDVFNGFSWDCLHDESPSAGYAVSAFKGREMVFNHAPNNFEIASFILDNADILFEKKNVLGAATKVVGCWQYEGQWYLDVSLVYNNRTLALQTGFLNDQIAIWDIANGQEIFCSEVSKTFKSFE